MWLDSYTVILAMFIYDVEHNSNYTAVNASRASDHPWINSNQCALQT